MSTVLTVSPDFNIKNLAGWFILKNSLQQALDASIQFEIFEDFEQQRASLRAQEVDLIYANPYEATWLVRELGYRAVARPRNQADEALIAVRANSPLRKIEDLEPGCTIATTNDPDVHMMGAMMIEPADLDAYNVCFKRCQNSVLVAKEVIRGRAAAGFFLANTFNELSRVIQSKLRVIVQSETQMIHHLFLVGPSLTEHDLVIGEALLGLSESDNGRRILRDIGLEGWESVTEEEVELMIDVVDSLVCDIGSGSSRFPRPKPGFARV